MPRDPKSRRGRLPAPERHPPAPTDPASPTGASEEPPRLSDPSTGPGPSDEDIEAFVRSLPEKNRDRLTWLMDNGLSEVTFVRFDDDLELRGRCPMCREPVEESAVLIEPWTSFFADCHALGRADSETVLDPTASQSMHIRMHDPGDPDFDIGRIRYLRLDMGGRYLDTWPVLYVESFPGQPGEACNRRLQVCGPTCAAALRRHLARHAAGVMVAGPHPITPN